MVKKMKKSKKYIKHILIIVIVACGFVALNRASGSTEKSTYDALDLELHKIAAEIDDKFNLKSTFDSNCRISNVSKFEKQLRCLTSIEVNFPKQSIIKSEKAIKDLDLLVNKYTNQYIKESSGITPSNILCDTFITVNEQKYPHAINLESNVVGLIISCEGTPSSAVYK
jgi:hypothetical protein